MERDFTPKSRKENLVVQELEGEVLIYDLEKNKAFCLNETSALVWKLCDGNTSVSDLSEDLSKKLNSPVNEDLVWLALEQLKKEKLIENEIGTPTGFEGLSRREVVKKVGLGAMVALPIVASMVAPTSVYAQASCLPPGSMQPVGCPCDQPQDCSGGSCMNTSMTC